MLLLAACGDAATPVPTVSAGDFADTGATCDGKGQVSGQVLVLTDETQGLQPVVANLTLNTAGAQPVTLKTDPDGNYSVNDLSINEYEIEATVPEGVNGKVIQPKKKYLTVDDCQIETVSMVLLAEGVKAPETPPAPPQQQVVYVNQQPHYSVTSNPFFWMWLLDRPGYYGYSYPPYYTTHIYNQGGYIYVPQTPHFAPSNANYSYTSYKSGDTATKVKSDPPVVSKGTTRVGSSGYVKPVVTSSSKGSSRPGGVAINTPKSGSSSSTSKGSGSSNVSSPGGSSSSSGVKSGGSSSTGGGSSNVSSPGSSSKGSSRPGKKK
jgi:hypothetical protein